LELLVSVVRFEQNGFMTQSNRCCRLQTVCFLLLLACCRRLLLLLLFCHVVVGIFMRTIDGYLWNASSDLIQVPQLALVVLIEKYAYFVAGRMDAGFANMNQLTVVQASQGLCAFLIKSGLQAKGVVVGHDHRHNSEIFAKLTAGVFLAHGIKVYFFRQLVHTPMVVRRSHPSIIHQ